MFLGNTLDRRVLHEQGCILGLLHIEFEEGLRSKGGVGCYGDPFRLREAEQAFLREVGVMFDLQRRGADFGIAEKIHEELAVEVTDTDALGQPLSLNFFHSRPRLLYAGLSRHDVLAVVGEAGGVSVGRVDIFEGDGEVDDVQVKVIDAPVFELFLADGLNFVAVVEGIPEFGDKEEIFALDQAFFDGAGNTLAGFYFIAVVWRSEH